MARHHVTVHIDATCAVGYHCGLDNDRMAVRIVDQQTSPVTVYLNGTRNDLEWFALRLRDAVAAIPHAMGDA